MKKKKFPVWQESSEEMDVIEEMDEMDEMDAGPTKPMMMPQGGKRMMLAHAYVPWQYYNKAFSPQEALMKGTLFPELWGVYPIPK